MNATNPKPENEQKLEASDAERETKRTYRAPQLRRLGSVRDLTLGSMGLMADFGTFMG